jgi:hypothetical protein
VLLGRCSTLYYALKHCWSFVQNGKVLYIFFFYIFN